MTAANESHATVASIVAKVEQGTTITSQDLEELRRAVRRNPEVSLLWTHKNVISGYRRQQQQHQKLIRSCDRPFPI